MVLVTIVLQQSWSKLHDFGHENAALFKNGVYLVVQFMLFGSAQR
jgi:hypothetical protein